ncbi:AsmA family protein [Cribrihabitans sp. XS_ASV171]
MRFLFRLALILLAACGLALGALILMPKDRLASVLSDQLSARTGRAVEIAGEARVTFWPVLGIETGRVTIANADWAGPDPMLTADSLAVGVQAASLLGGDLQIRRIEAQNPVLRLERQDTRANWLVADRAGTGATGSRAAPASGTVTLERLTLENARLILIEDGRRLVDQPGVTITARWPDHSGPLSASAILPLNGEQVQSDLALADPRSYLSGGISGLTLSAVVAGGSLEFTGRASGGGALQGTATINAPDTTRLMRTLNRGALRLPRGFGQSATVSTKLTLTGDRLSLRDLALDLDGNRLAGEADITLAAKPVFTARMQADRLDFSGMGASGPGDRTGAARATGWSENPIDASALALADGTLSFRANAIQTGVAALGETRATLTIDRARAVLQLDPVSVFQGTVRGQLVANNRNGLSVGGDLAATGVELRDALTAIAGVTRLSGAASGRLDFLGVGQSEAQIMRSLSGSGALDMGRGVISGIDLDALMGRGDGGGGTTVFNSLSASFRMQQGDLLNDDLLMSLDNFRADGAGRIGLGARDIDYLLTPVALRANAGQGLAVPVRIVGPWADPEYRPDLTQAIEAAAGVRAEEVESRTREALRQKLGEELDREIQDGDDIEDLIKDRLEEEAARGLRRLLGMD